MSNNGKNINNLNLNDTPTNNNTNNNDTNKTDLSRKDTISSEELPISEGLNLCWKRINNYSRDSSKKEKLIKYFKILRNYLFNELRNNKMNKTNENIVQNFFKDNLVLPKLTNLVATTKDNREIILDFVSNCFRLVKFQENIISDNKPLMRTIFQCIILLFDELSNDGPSFKLKNEFSLFLNVVTRLLLNYPNLIPYFKVKKINPYTHNEYEDYFIFTSLLNLLDIDSSIKEFEYKKYIRRSLIVYLSFDEINNSYYLQTKTTFVEKLINKLCNFYQMLPEYFDFENSTNTLEIACNLNFEFHVLCTFYFDFIDYINFLNKIANCLTIESIKKKFSIYFFNKFLLENVQKFILNDDIKINRSHLQYIISILYFTKNHIIIDDIIHFLFGFRESKIQFKSKSDSDTNKNDNEENFTQVEDYNYNKHKSNEIAYKVLNNLIQSKEYINIVIYSLFELLFQKRPYAMIKKFVKPYTDYAFEKYKNNKKWNKTYPIALQFIELLNFYNKFNDKNLLINLQASTYKNFSYYINYDIDFYSYYLYQKRQEEEKNNKKMENSVRPTFNDFYDNDENNFTLTMDSFANNYDDCLSNVTISNFEEEFIILDNKILKDAECIEEGLENLYFLFMKNLYEKLINFFDNNIIENIFLTNLLITIISVPCLNFDNDLVQCNTILLDNDSNNKFSFLTVFKYLSQEIVNKIGKNERSKNLFKNLINVLFRESSKGVYNNFLRIHMDEEGMEKNKERFGIINHIIFCEFIKEYLCSIAHKHKFEGLIENLYGFYCLELEKNEKF